VLFTSKYFAVQKKHVSFASAFESSLRSIRLVVRTSGFHPGNRGSIPLWTTTQQKNRTLLFAYNPHFWHIEGFSFDTTGLGSSPDFTYNTIRAYKSSWNSLSRYLNSNDIELSKLDYGFIEGYYSYLRNIEKLQPDSAYKNIKHLYRIIKVCILNKWLITATSQGDLLPWSEL
jgi:hypothetical protein